jgi:glycine/D-amino acid oxidase-like deaminating enzyme
MTVDFTGDPAELNKQYLSAKATVPEMQLLSVEEACARLPILRQEKVHGAIYDPTASDIDTDALHQGYLRGIRRHNGEVHTDCEVLGLSRDAEGVWQVQTHAGTFSAPVIINAAGAWADKIGELAGANPGPATQAACGLHFRRPRGRGHSSLAHAGQPRRILLHETRCRDVPRLAGQRRSGRTARCAA